MYSFDNLWLQLQAAGLPGAVIALAVLLFVYAGEFTSVFKSGLAKRVAAVLASALFAGLQPGEVQSALVAAVGLVLSTAAHWLIDAVKAELAKRKA